MAKALWALSLSLFAGLGIAQAATLYVNAAATSGSNNGTSWTNAYTDLQVAMNAASAGDEIWVVAGTYTPSQKPTGVTTSDSRLQTFYLNKDIKIYGGFAGTETALLHRNYATNVTILSGDIGTVNTNTDNCYHVFITTGLTSAAVIDGFTIKGGYSTTFTTVSMDYNGVTFNSNSGSGIYNKSSSPTLTRLTIWGNAANENGGGMLNVSSSPTMTNITIVDNSANYGGGIYNLLCSSFTMVNVRVSGNTATNNGGGIFNYTTSPILTNVTISANTAVSGDGIYNNFNSSSPNIRNSIIWGDAVVNNSSSTPTFSYSIVQGSGGSSAWNSSYGTDGGKNLDTDPLFTDASSGNFSLQTTSPAINVGSAAIWTATGLTTDLAGEVRPYGVVDMGAFENLAVLPVEMLYFTGKTTEMGNLLTWATASEENNAGFEIEKSTDARTFEKIGFVAGKGTTTEQQTYEFLDKNTTNGVVYYRLKQTDFDGRFEYSKIISLASEGVTAAVLIYPNPVKDVLTIQNAQETTAIIYNALGQPVQQFAVQNALFNINLNELPKGVYTLQFQQANGATVTKQFVK